MNPDKNEIGTQPLATNIFNELQKEILSGKIRPGDKLTEQSVCKKYNVSRTPVREAFRQLESDGLIENVPNRGAYVIGLTKRDVSDLFDLRCIFEMQAVQWAIERMDDDEVDKLRETIEFMEFYTLKNDADKVMNFNQQFHEIIYKGTKDRMLYQTLSKYQVYIKHSAPARTFDSDYLNIILTEHKNIFEAFENRNIAAGRSAMEYHIKQSKVRRMARFF